MGQGIQPTPNATSGLSRRGRGTGVDFVYSLRLRLANNEDVASLTVEQLKKLPFTELANYIEQHSEKEIIAVLRREKDYSFAADIARFLITGDPEVSLGPDEDTQHHKLLIEQFIPLFSSYLDKAVEKVPEYICPDHAYARATTNYLKLDTKNLLKLYDIFSLSQMSPECTLAEQVISSNPKAYTLRVSEYIKTVVETLTASPSDEEKQKIEAFVEELVSRSFNLYSVQEDNKRHIISCPKYPDVDTVFVLGKDINRIVRNTPSFRERSETSLCALNTFITEELLQKFNDITDDDFTRLHELYAAQSQPLTTDTLPYLHKIADDSKLQLPAHERIPFHLAHAYGVSYEQALVFCRWLGQTHFGLKEAW